MVKIGHNDRIGRRLLAKSRKLEVPVKVLKHYQLEILSVYVTITNIGLGYLAYRLNQLPSDIRAIALTGVLFLMIINAFYFQTIFIDYYHRFVAFLYKRHKRRK